MIPRIQWNSQFGFLMAVVSSAVGLGNIWRFSYLTYKYGGGAFLIPYLIALLTAGIPLLILEYGIGHKSKGSAPKAFHFVAPRWEWLGWWSVLLVMFGVAFYYSVIIAWCLNYFIFSFDLAWGAQPDHFFFKEYLQLSDSPSALGQIRPAIFYSLFVIWLINWLVLYRGIQRGIELAGKILMPVLFVLTLIMVIWSVQLEGAWIGIKAYIEPDFSRLDDLDVWIDAYTQIFFTLSLGYGVMIAYSSYLPEQSNITGHAIRVALINCGYSIMMGFGVFAILGFMATEQQQAITDVATEGIGLAFVVFPKAISLMPGGRWFGMVFFLCLTVAGISSSVSIIESFVSAGIDKFNCNRKKLVTYLSIFGFFGSLVFCTKAGLLWLDILDHFITHYGLLSIGILECIAIGWVFKISDLQNHINHISTIQLGKGWRFLIRWFLPILFTSMFIGDIYDDIRIPYGGYSWTALLLIGRDWILLTLAVAFYMAGRAWKEPQQMTITEHFQLHDSAPH